MDFSYRNFRKLILLVIISFFWSHIAAQNQRIIDSLSKILEQNPPDTTLLLVKLNLGRNYHNFNPDLALDYYKDTEQIGDKILNKNNSDEELKFVQKNLAPAFYNIGLLNLYVINNYEESLNYFNKAVILFESVNDHLKVSQTYAHIGDVYSRQNLIRQAIEAYNKVDFNFKTQPKYHLEIAFTLNSIGWFYLSQMQYDIAEDYFFDALSFSKKLDNKYIQAVLNLNLGKLRNGQEKYSKALEHLNIAEILYKELDNKLLLADCYSGIADAYNGQNKYDEAINYYYQGNELYKLSDEIISMGFNLNSMGIIYYYDKDDNSKALLVFEESYKIFINENMLSSAALASNMLGRIYDNEKDYTNALSYYNKAVELYGKTEEIKNVADVLFDIANLYNLNAHYDLALEQYTRSIKLFEELNNTEKLIKIYTYRGEIFYNRGDFQNALEQYNLGLDLSKIKNIETQYTLLNNIGLVYDNKGDYDTAVYLYEKALDYNMQKNNLSGLAMNYINLGKVEMNRGNSIQALEYFEKALPLVKEPNLLSTIYSNIGMVNIYLGNYNKAKEVLNLALEYNNKVPNTAAKIQILINIGNAFKEENDNPNALEYYQKSLELALETDNFNIILSYLNIGAVYAQQGNFSKSLEYTTQALNKSKELEYQHGIVNSLNFMGRTYIALKDFDKALELFSEALTKAKILGDKLNIVESLTWIAYLKHINGELDSALNTYTECYHLFIELGIPTGLASIYVRLGSVYYDLHQFDLSEEYTQKSLEIAKSINNYEKIKSAYYMMKWLAIKKGELDDADHYAIESIKINNHTIQSNFGILSESAQELFIKTLEKEYMDFISYAGARYKDNPKIAEVVFNNTIKLKGLLLKSSMGMRNAILSSNDTSLIGQYHRWVLIKEQMAYLLTAPGHAQNSNLENFKKQAINLETELVKRSKEFSDFSVSQNITWQDIQQSLEPNEAVIEFTNFKYVDYSKNLVYFTDTIGYAALIIRSDSKFPVMVPIFSINPQNDNIDSIHRHEKSNLTYHVDGNKRGAEILSQGNADSIYTIIWSKMEPYLENIKTIYYTPSGMLHNISFSAINYKDSTLLSDKYKLVYLASSTDLVVPKERRDIKTFNVAIYGGLNYTIDTTLMWTVAQKYTKNESKTLTSRSITIDDVVRSSTWNYLEGTLEEVETINTLLEANNINTQLFTANDGIEESVKSLEGRNSPEIIHFATHGFFFPDPVYENSNQNNSITIEKQQIFRSSDNPLVRSGLIMSGANNAWIDNNFAKGIEDGILTAYEVSTLDLHNTELVVMSACETGLGDIIGSEGVYGLQRSFKMAGVNNIVMSLWQVPDKETSEFMQLFYEYMLSNQSIGDAFRSAQKVMRNKYDPYYWAAFVLIE